MLIKRKDTCRESMGRLERSREREANREQESAMCFGGSFSCCVGAVLWASSGQSPCFVWPAAHLWTGSGSSPVVCASFSQDGFYRQGPWEAARRYCGLDPLPSLTPEAAFCKRVIPEVSMTSRMRNRWSLAFIQAVRGSSLLLPSSLS